VCEVRCVAESIQAGPLDEERQSLGPEFGTSSDWQKRPPWYPDFDMGLLVSVALILGSARPRREAQQKEKVAVTLWELGWSLCNVLQKYCPARTMVLGSHHEL
jgi:hypothetical protein